MVNIMTNNVNNKFNIGVQKLGMTSDNRHLYTMPDPDSNKTIKISVSDKDKDTFEKAVSNLNESGQEDFTPEGLEKKRLKVIATTFITSAIGLAIPGYFTRNSKTLIKVLSVVGGGVIGALAGAIVGFKHIVAPNTFKNAQKVRETMKTLDIRKEK